jgi:hypothetical protein
MSWSWWTRKSKLEGMNHHEAAPADQLRAAGALLIAGPVIYLLCEFIAAAAWTQPPYSYTYHFISNLGVSGPSELFGQYMLSPLAWLMNTGFFLFGVTTLSGIVLLRALPGWRRWAVLGSGMLLAIGGVLLALNPGSAEEMEHGGGHALGAMAAFIGGNLLSILLGRVHQCLGLSARLGRALVVFGAIGLLSMLAYFADVISGLNLLIGLVERGIVYPFLTGLICTGIAIWNRPRSV